MDRGAGHAFEGKETITRELREGSAPVRGAAYESSLWNPCRLHERNGPETPRHHQLNDLDGNLHSPSEQDRSAMDPERRASRRQIHGDDRR